MAGILTLKRFCLTLHLALQEEMSEKTDESRQARTACLQLSGHDHVRDLQLSTSISTLGQGATILPGDDGA